MCGILGWYSRHQAPDRERLLAALDTLRHRGPDDAGTYFEGGLALGHRRLSIIDIGPGGHQPMRDPSGRYTLVFNGEIYNYVELRSELEGIGHRFNGRSDTEVLLAALVEWGTDAHARLNGMWAFALWDSLQQELLLSRDRFGEKPLYYCRTDDGIAFASEPKALLALFPNRRRVNLESIRRFLGEGLLHSDEASFYDGISSLPSACWTTWSWKRPNPIPFRHWRYPESAEPVARSTDDAIEAFSDLFDDAVRIRIRSDVTVGLTLSGGLDSSAILASMRHQDPKRLPCFTSTYGVDGRGEIEWARVAAGAMSADLNEVQSSVSSSIETLSDIVWHLDSPTYSPAVIPIWSLMRRARESGVPVLLEGQGADELLAGYVQHAAVYLRSLSARSWLTTHAVGELRAFAQTFGLAPLMAWLARLQFPGMLETYRRQFGAAGLLVTWDGREAAMAQPAAMQYSGLLLDALKHDHGNKVLPGLLHYGDALSMAHGVETRLPFTDYRLVELVLRDLTAYLLRNGQSKWILRMYLERRRLQSIAARRDKIGYVTPLDSWLRGAGFAEMHDLVAGHSSRLRDLVDTQGLERLLRNFADGSRIGSHHIFRLITVEAWLRRCT